MKQWQKFVLVALVFGGIPLLMAQTGPTVFTPRLTVSPGPLTVTTGATTVQDITINGTCTGCTTTSPGGSDTQVQYNDGGAFGGDADMTFNEGTNTFTATNIAGNGSALTNLDAGDIATGTLAVARGGTGTTTSTGTGSVVLSASPALTGIVTANGDLVVSGETGESGLGANFTGFTTPPGAGCVATSVSARVQTLKRVTAVKFNNACTETSNATTFTITSVPNEFCYTSDFTGGPTSVRVLVPVVDNGATVLGNVVITESVGTCTYTFGVGVGSSGGFTASGTKGLPSTGVNLVF